MKNTREDVHLFCNIFISSDKMHQLGDKIHQSTSNLPPPPSLTAIRDYTHNITRNITRP